MVRTLVMLVEVPDDMPLEEIKPLTERALGVHFPLLTSARAIVHESVECVAQALSNDFTVESFEE